MKRQVVTAVVAGLLVTGLVSVAFSYEQVGEGHVGVVKKFGKVTGEELQPGPHFISPLKGTQGVEIRPRTYKGTVDVTTLNGTTFDVQYVVRYRVNPGNATTFVVEWNNIGQVEQRLINPTVEDRLRKEGAGIKSSVIFTQDGRERLTVAARERLSSEFSDEAMTLEAVQITNVGIPNDYQRALNEKEIAKQQVQKEQYNIQKEQAKKEQKIIQAEATAESNRIIAESLTREVLVDKYIDKLDETDTVYIPVGDDGLPRFVNATADDGR